MGGSLHALEEWTREYLRQRLADAQDAALVIEARQGWSWPVGLLVHRHSRAAIVGEPVTVLRTRPSQIRALAAHLHSRLRPHVRPSRS